MTVTPLSPSTSPILQEIVRQMRAADPYGTYRTWRDGQAGQLQLASELRHLPHLEG
ncbi:hypothetical protein [Synechococcus sp. W55.1]|uniref:hypothetical protein n=1 Tax=Synechococcus sp. W55.1 TaxID=2964512 RepID=UPI0039C2A834